MTPISVESLLSCLEGGDICTATPVRLPGGAINERIGQDTARDLIRGFQVNYDRYPTAIAVDEAVILKLRKVAPDGPETIFGVRAVPLRGMPKLWVAFDLDPALELRISSSRDLRLRLDEIGAEVAAHQDAMRERLAEHGRIRAELFRRNLEPV